MYGDVFGSEADDLSEACLKVPDIFFRKTCDEIGIDDIEACLTGDAESFANIVGAVVAAYQSQSLIFHGLRIYAYAPDPESLKSIEFFLCDRIRSSGLYSEFNTCRINTDKLLILC